MKLSPDDLGKSLGLLPLEEHLNLLVSIESTDDAGVFKIAKEMGRPWCGPWTSLPAWWAILNQIAAVP